MQQVAFTANRHYSASVWMRAVAPIEVALELRQRDAPFTVYSGRTFRLTSAWTQYRIGATTDNAPGFFMICAQQPGTFWADDASLTASSTVMPAGAVPREFFGMHIQNAKPAHWPDVGNAVGAVRIWNTDAENSTDEGGQWALINNCGVKPLYGDNCAQTPVPPVCSQYDFTWFDAHLNRAFERGVREMLINLGRPPRWAAARPNESATFGCGSSSEPKSGAIWRAWVTKVRDHVRDNHAGPGRQFYWEVWNEPNLANADGGSYTGTKQKLLSLAQQAHAILKQVPGNRLVSPAVTDDPNYLEDCLALGSGMYADVIGFHFYQAFRATPERLYYEAIPNVRAVVQRYAGGKPVWNTEAGWLRDVQCAAGAHHHVSFAGGPGYVARAYLELGGGGQPLLFLRLGR